MILAALAELVSVSVPCPSRARGTFHGAFPFSRSNFANKRVAASLVYLPPSPLKRKREKARANFALSGIRPKPGRISDLLQHRPSGERTGGGGGDKRTKKRRSPCIQSRLAIYCGCLSSSPPRNQPPIAYRRTVTICATRSSARGRAINPEFPSVPLCEFSRIKVLPSLLAEFRVSLRSIDPTRPRATLSRVPIKHRRSVTPFPLRALRAIISPLIRTINGMWLLRNIGYTYNVISFYYLSPLSLSLYLLPFSAIRGRGHYVLLGETSDKTVAVPLGNEREFQVQ